MKEGKIEWRSTYEGQTMLKLEEEALQIVAFQRKCFEGKTNWKCEWEENGMLKGAISFVKA